MNESQEVYLKPGYLTSDEALTRILMVIAGPGISWHRSGHGAAWFYAGVKGKLIIENDLLNKIEQVSYIKITSLNYKRVANKNEVLGSCIVKRKLIPEDVVSVLEGLLMETGNLIAIEPSP